MKRKTIFINQDEVASLRRIFRWVFNFDIKEVGCIWMLGSRINFTFYVPHEFDKILVKEALGYVKSELREDIDITSQGPEALVVRVSAEPFLKWLHDMAHTGLRFSFDAYSGEVIYDTSELSIFA